jgi:hypothetical protein
VGITTAVMTPLVAALTGGVITPFSNANTKLGVGDGSAAFVASQTDLQGTNKYRQAADVTYPSISGNVMTVYATFPASVANFAWNEWGTFNAASGGTMLNRSVTFTGGSPGTKINTQAWQLQAVLTFQAA